MNVGVHMMNHVLLLSCLASPAYAEVRTMEPTVVAQERFLTDGDPGSGACAEHPILSDVLLDMSSKNALVASFAKGINNGREPSASVQHVYVNMPRDRFNVVMTLDGKSHLRMNPGASTFPEACCGVSERSG